MLEKLQGLDTPKSAGNNLHLNEFLTEWRSNVLGYIKGEDGKLERGECLVNATRGANIGDGISETTWLDYGSDCLALEKREESAFALSDKRIIEKIRLLLAYWINHPTHYNGLRNILSRALAHAVAIGLIPRNPMSDIANQIIPKRKVFIPDDAYIQITSWLSTHHHNKRIFDG